MAKPTRTARKLYAAMQELDLADRDQLHNGNRTPELVAIPPTILKQEIEWTKRQIPAAVTDLAGRALSRTEANKARTRNLDDRLLGVEGKIKRFTPERLGSAIRDLEGQVSGNDRVSADALRVLTDQLDVSLAEARELKSQLQAMIVDSQGTNGVTSFNYPCILQIMEVIRGNIVIVEDDGAENVSATALTNAATGSIKHLVEFRIEALNGRSLTVFDGVEPVITPAKSANPADASAPTIEWVVDAAKTPAFEGNKLSIYMIPDTETNPANKTYTAAADSYSATVDISGIAFNVFVVSKLKTFNAV